MIEYYKRRTHERKIPTGKRKVVFRKNPDETPEMRNARRQLHVAAENMATGITKTVYDAPQFLLEYARVMEQTAGIQPGGRPMEEHFPPHAPHIDKQIIVKASQQFAKDTPPSDMVRTLDWLVNGRVVSKIIGIDNPELLRRWISGRESLPPEIEDIMRRALYVASMVGMKHGSFEAHKLLTGDDKGKTTGEILNDPEKFQCFVEQTINGLDKPTVQHRKVTE